MIHDRQSQGARGLALGFVLLSLCHMIILFLPRRGLTDDWEWESVDDQDSGGSLERPISAETGPRNI